MRRRWRVRNSRGACVAGRVLLWLTVALTGFLTSFYAATMLWAVIWQHVWLQ